MRWQSRAWRTYIQPHNHVIYWGWARMIWIIWIVLNTVPVYKLWRTILFLDRRLWRCRDVLPLVLSWSFRELFIFSTYDWLDIGKNQFHRVYLVDVRRKMGSREQKISYANLGYDPWDVWHTFVVLNTKKPLEWEFLSKILLRAFLYIWIIYLYNFLQLNA